jgi:uncharacterized repeat protein (TIGR03803 family)
VFNRMLLAVVALALASFAQAQSFTFSTVATLTSNEAFPNSPLILDSSGNFWDSTFGGTVTLGVIYEVTKAGVVSDIYFFGDSTVDGDFPSSLARDSAGNLYGTSNGGDFSDGLIFKVSPSGEFTQLHSFTNSEASDSGSEPVILDAAGNVYGAGNGGKLSGGAVFKVEPGGAYSTLYNFCSLKNCADGDTPNAPIRDKAGNIYGSTYFGGNAGCGGCQTGDGVVYKVEASGVQSVLHTFKGGSSDGANPNNKLKQDTKGNLYGTTATGGTHGAGIVFKVSSTTGEETVLHNFCSSSKCADGQFPFGPVVLDALGNVYGTALGSNHNSVVWEVTAAGKGLVAYTFPGATTAGALTIDSAGNLYSTYGNQSSFPAIFKLTLVK